MTKKILPPALARSSTSLGFTRRQFVQSTLAGSAGLAASGLVFPTISFAQGGPDGTPKRGGDLRVAILGGGSADTLDAHLMNSQPDLSRVMTLYEGLTTLDVDGQVVNVLAESLETNDTATEWTIRLRKGVQFHNGKTLAPEDVVFSLRRISDPNTGAQGATGLIPLDLDNVRIVDDVTLVVPTKTPFATLPETLSAVYYYGIVPVGYDPQNPVGTGPFKYESFTPGQQSVFARFENYWQEGLPYLDKVTIIDSFQTDVAAFNAVQAGEVDVYAYATLSLANQAGASGLQSLVSKPGLYVPFNLNTGLAPFEDVRVRQAFKLLIDRQQLIDQALSGYGIPGNDIFSRWDPAYDETLIRERDVDKAKFLLKEAGHENLSVELASVEVAPGAFQAAQVFARQAKDAGVNVSVRQVPVDAFYQDYGKWPFCQDYWVHQPYLTTVSLGTLPTSPYNSTGWNHEKYNALYAEAQSTVDPKLRAEIIRQMQRIDFDEGGTIIWSFNQIVDLLAENVRGFAPANTGNALGNFGFATAWLA